MELTWLAIIASLCMGAGAVLVFLFAVKKNYFRNIEDAKYQVFWPEVEELLDSAEPKEEEEENGEPTFNAPLEEPVNVMHPPNPAKAPWYFLGLQEMASYSAFWGGVGIPGIEVLILLLVPYIDRKRWVWAARRAGAPSSFSLSCS